MSDVQTLVEMRERYVPLDCEVVVVEEPRQDGEL